MNVLALFPNASKDTIALNIGDPIQPAIAQPAPADALGAKDKGKKESCSRIAVRYRIYRVRLQDADNAYGSTKALSDALILSRLLPDDSPDKISLTVEQEKVSTRDEERIELTIQYP